MFHEYSFFDRSIEVVTVTAIVAVALPLWFHIFMYWTTRRRKFVGKEFYQEVNIWLGEIRRKYALDKPRPKSRRQPPEKEK